MKIMRFLLKWHIYYVGQENIKNQLVFIKSKFAFLHNTTTSLEKHGLSLASSISLAEDIRLRLNRMRGENGISIKTIIENVFNKNVGYQLLIKFPKCYLEMKTISTDYLKI